MSVRPAEREYVVCLSNQGYKASLVVRKLYETLPDDEGSRLGPCLPRWNCLQK